MNFRKVLLDVLTALECSEEEKEIFLKVLSSNGLKVSEIADRTGIKRTNCYRFVEALVAKRLLNLDLNSKINKYFATSPNDLKALLDKKTRLINELKIDFSNIVPDLDKIYKISESTTKVRYYYNNDVVDIVSDVVLHYDYKAFYNPIVLSKNHLRFFKDFVNNLDKSRRNIREILVNSSNNIIEKMLRGVKNPNYKFKLLAKEGLFKSDIVLFNSKVLLVNYRSNVVVEIDDAELSASLETIHDFIWNNLDGLSNKEM